MIIYRLLITLPEIAVLFADGYGTYYQTPPVDSDVQDSPPVTLAMQNVREYRDQLLTESDYTQLPDVPLTSAQVAAWRVYRQALRDYPKQINVQHWSGPAWPVAPF